MPVNTRITPNIAQPYMPRDKPMAPSAEPKRIIQIAPTSHTINHLQSAATPNDDLERIQSRLPCLSSSHRASPDDEGRIAKAWESTVELDDVAPVIMQRL
jgi:hypothetical protein